MSEEFKTPLQKLSEQYGSVVVGFLGAVILLVGAYALPAHREELVSSAGIIGFLTLFIRGRVQWGYRALAMLGAAVCLTAAFFMPDQAKELVNTGSIVAIVSLFFW